MALTKNATWKHCITCQLWGGQRTTNVFRDLAECANDQVKGECIGGGWNRQQKTAMGSCSKWEKWAVLVQR